MCSIIYSSAARFAARTKHLNVWRRRTVECRTCSSWSTTMCTNAFITFSMTRGKRQHQHQRATGPSHPSRCLVGSSQGWMMCDPVREHRFCSCHLLGSFVHGRIRDHPTLRRRVRALRRLRRALTLRQFSVACTILVPVNIRATTRRYRKIRHTQITLGHAIVRQLSYPSNISPQIVVKLSFSLRRHSFNGGGGFAISYPECDASIWKTARANYPKNAGDYPIAIHHPWHVTSSVDAAGGQQWLMTAAAHEI